MTRGEIITVRYTLTAAEVRSALLMYARQTVAGGKLAYPTDRAAVTFLPDGGATIESHYYAQKEVEPKS